MPEEKVAPGSSRYIIILAALVIGGGIIFTLRQPETGSAVPLVNNNIAAPAQPAPAELSPREQAFQTINDTKATTENRMLALRNILETEPKLDSGEKQDIRSIFLDAKASPSLRNDAFLLLCMPENRYADLGRDLVEMWNRRDSETGDAKTWNDYILQHFSAAHEYADNKDEIEKILLEEAKKPSSEDGKIQYSGTALISLQKVAQVKPQLQKKIIQLAKDTLQEEKPDYNKMVSAFQIVTETRDPYALDSARKIAHDEAALTRARTAACGYLAAMGTNEDLALLEKLAKSGDSRLKLAATYNLKALTKRLTDS